ncbi:hypothetical protein D3C75_1290940 [compost metagenome]
MHTLMFEREQILSRHYVPQRIPRIRHHRQTSEEPRVFVFAAGLISMAMVDTDTIGIGS